MESQSKGTTRLVTVGDHEFRVAGQTTTVYAGEIHYWRLDRDKWSDVLDKVKGMGFDTISLYIPWEAHELERGRFDFGQVDPRTDIDAFLTLCEAKGFGIVVRPGPQINSEMTWFGYPRRILEDPELHALNGRGLKAVLTQVPRPIPALAYASDKFYQEAALWYDAICPILAKHSVPNGRLVAAQVDNEMAFFFHVNAYACDYHPTSITRYRVFLEEKYGSLEACNRVYGTHYATFEEIDPPRRFAATARSAIPFYTDWIVYRERYLVDAISRLAGMMRDRGLDQIALFHNYPHPLGPGGAVSGFTTPFDIPGLEEKVDYVGFDIYSRKELYEHVKTIVSYVVGTSRFPYVPEFISGVWPWYLNPGDLQDEEFVTKAALMHGIKGFSRYTIVERDRWLDSPVRRDGRVRPARYAMFRQANEVAVDHRFVDLRRAADVLLLANRDYDRLEAASVLVSFPGDFLETPSGFSEYPTFMTVAEEPLGFDEPIQVAKAEWFNGCYRALGESGYAFLLSDSALSPERWRRFAVVVLSTFEYLDARLAEALVAYAKEGGTVVLGPKVPQLGLDMQPDDALVRELVGAERAPLRVGERTIGDTYRLGAGAIARLDEPADLGSAIEAVTGGAELVRFRRNDTRLDVAVHRDRKDPNRAVVYLANPTTETIDADVELNVPLGAVREIWDGRPVEIDGNRLRDRLPPYTIRIFESRR
jgi:beta-galactosidase